MTNLKKYLVALMVISMAAPAFAANDYVETSSDLELEAEVEALNILDHEVLEKESRKEALEKESEVKALRSDCLLYTSPSPRDQRGSRMPSSA